VNVVMAMSSARKTLDFEREFAQTRDAVGVVLGVTPTDASASTAPDGASKSAGSQDSTR
jgi:cytochrome c biogenesis protein